MTKFQVYAVTNNVQYIEHEKFASHIDSVWDSEMDAKIRLEELATELAVGLEWGDTVFYEENPGPNVDYSEWVIDVWGVSSNG